MAQLSNSLMLDATFYDLDGSVLNSSFQAVALASERLPFQVRRVFLKTEVPYGADFEVVLKIEDRECFRFRARLPVPAQGQEEVARLFENASTLVDPICGSRTPEQDEALKALARLGNLEADIWGRFAAQANGFVEFEFHAGQAGLNAPKCIIRNLLWARTKP